MFDYPNYASITGLETHKKFVPKMMKASYLLEFETFDNPKDSRVICYHLY